MKKPERKIHGQRILLFFALFLIGLFGCVGQPEEEIIPLTEEEKAVVMAWDAPLALKWQQAARVLADTEPPVIEGVVDQRVAMGGTISYKTGVTIKDNVDTQVECEIDHSEVDLNVAGVYTVTYRATDKAGNSTEVTATITVYEPDPGEENREILDELVAAALEECLTEGMTEREQLYAMFWHVKNNMSYTGTSDKTSQVNEAISGFQYGIGDCFTYFSMLKAMMEACGFETLDVERINGATRHYWSLVMVEGEWYHIDACPRSASKDKYWYAFLRTDEELREFSEKYNGYYTFDESLYPRTP